MGRGRLGLPGVLRLNLRRGLGGGRLGLPGILGLSRRHGLGRGRLRLPGVLGLDLRRGLGRGRLGLPGVLGLDLRRGLLKNRLRGRLLALRRRFIFWLYFKLDFLVFSGLPGHYGKIVDYAGGLLGQRLGCRVIRSGL